MLRLCQTKLHKLCAFQGKFSAILKLCYDSVLHSALWLVDHLMLPLVQPQAGVQKTSHNINIFEVNTL